MISELHNSSLALQPADLFALLTDQTRLSPCLRGLLLPGFHQSSHLTLALDMTTVALDILHGSDSHRLDLQLASLHENLPLRPFVDQPVHERPQLFSRAGQHEG